MYHILKVHDQRNGLSGESYFFDQGRIGKKGKRAFPDAVAEPLPGEHGSQKGYDIVRHVEAHIHAENDKEYIGLRQRIQDGPHKAQQTALVTHCQFLVQENQHKITVPAPFLRNVHAFSLTR